MLDSESPTLSTRTVLKENDLYLVGNRHYKVADGESGLYRRDTRFLSRYEWRLDGQRPQHLLQHERYPFWLHEQSSNANVGYTIIGKPAGVVANNTMSFAVAEELRVSPGFAVVGEVFGSTAAVGESGAEGAAPSAESQLTPELSGGEIVAALGLQMHAARGLTYSVGLSIDGNRAVLVHPGISIAF